MFKKLAYLAIFVGAAAATTLVACSSNTTTSTPRDFATGLDGSTVGDGGGNGDMNVMKTYMATTPNEVDTDTIGGNFGQGTAVSMTGLIVLTPVESFEASSHTQCKYETWVQDPACTTPPCGILIITQPIPKPTGAMYCPYADATTTVLKSTQQGDVIDVNGVIDIYSMSATAPATGTVVQHEINIDTISTTATKHALPTPISVSETTAGLFVPYSGAGWAQYEATYIKLVPPTGTTDFTASTPDMYGNWTLTPGGATFADTFDFLYSPKDAGTGIVAGGMYTAMQGVVTLTFGGSIDPISSGDFIK